MIGRCSAVRPDVRPAPGRGPRAPARATAAGEVLVALMAAGLIHSAQMAGGPDPETPLPWLIFTADRRAGA